MKERRYRNIERENEEKERRRENSFDFISSFIF